MRVSEPLLRLIQRPRAVLGVAVALQWVTVAVVGLRAERVDDGLLPLVQSLLVAPLALLCAYVIGRRLGGDALGAWTLLVWVAAPWLAPLLTLAPYDTVLRDHVLPAAVGLTSDLGYLEGVLLLAALTLLTFRTRRAAAAAAALAAPVVIVWATRAASFPELSLGVLDGHMTGLREYFWSQRLLQWVPVAGAVAVARRSPWLAVALSTWLGGYLVLRTAQPGVGFEDGELLLRLLPALPAYLLLAAALPLLVPTLAARLGRLATPVLPRPAASALPAAPAAGRGSSSGRTAAR